MTSWSPPTGPTRPCGGPGTAEGGPDRGSPGGAGLRGSRRVPDGTGWDRAAVRWTKNGRGPPHGRRAEADRRGRHCQGRRKPDGKRSRPCHRKPGEKRSQPHHRKPDGKRSRPHHRTAGRKRVRRRGRAAAGGTCLPGRQMAGPPRAAPSADGCPALRRGREPPRRGSGVAHSRTGVERWRAAPPRKAAGQDRPEHPAAGRCPVATVAHRRPCGVDGPVTPWRYP